MKVATDCGLVETCPFGNFIACAEPHQIIETGKGVNFYHDKNVIDNKNAGWLTARNLNQNRAVIIYIFIVYS
jgi:hypothetical protein